MPVRVQLTKNNLFSESHCETYATEEHVDSNHLERNISTEECIPSHHFKRDNRNEESVKFIDSQRPGLHISTILRQIMFDVLYGVEFVILLTFGFSSDVKVICNKNDDYKLSFVIMKYAFLPNIWVFNNLFLSS